MACLILALLAIPFAQVPTRAQESATVSSRYALSEVPDSLTGLQTQVDELVRVAKTRDQANWQIALAAFSLPNPGAWFEANFASAHIAKLTEDYPKVRDGHLGHISWVIGHNQDAPNFRIHVELSEMPSPPSGMGFESLLPRPLREVHLQNFRFTPAADSGSTPPSWVSSFVFDEGHFRVVGGTYPFWAEKLTPIRGPMSLPPAMIRGMTVQGMAYQHDQKGGAIISIVQLEVKVARDGHVSKIKVLSGDNNFVEDAKNYIKAANFGALPDVPQLANAERKWEFEVAFFRSAEKLDP